MSAISSTSSHPLGYQIPQRTRKLVIGAGSLASKSNPAYLRISGTPHAFRKIGSTGPF